MNSELKEFLEWTKTVRRQFEIDMDETWLTKPPIERVAIENLLIAYDQMAERLRTPSPSPEIKTAEDILRQHLHGFSDEQFEKEISHFPLCEVPFAMERYHNQFAGDGWISVEDRLPEDESDLYKNDGFTESSAMVLVLTDCESIINNSRVKMAVGEKQWTWVMNIHEEQITHWTRCLPLPSPPQNTKES